MDIIPFSSTCENGTILASLHLQMEGVKLDKEILEQLIETFESVLYELDDQSQYEIEDKKQYEIYELLTKSWELIGQVRKEIATL